MGAAQGIQIWFDRHPVGSNVKCIGADISDECIAIASRLKKSGLLPPDMSFSKLAIQDANKLMQSLRSKGLEPRRTVMMIGNGLHELSETELLDCLRQYALAGIRLVITEESLLDSQAILGSGWNTYHAGFRLIHALSGQSLRPSCEIDGLIEPVRSWSDVFKASGYTLRKDCSRESRRLVLADDAPFQNQPSSKTYFLEPDLHGHE